MRQFFRTKRAFWLVGTLAVVGVAVWVGFLSMGQASSDVQSVEINEYQGEKLGSVDDFHENSIRGVQTVDPGTYQLAVDGLVTEPASYGYAELQSMSHVGKLVTIHCVEGWSVKALWEGLSLPELLAMSQPTGDANTIIFHAADGYTTSLPLDFVMDRNLIIADHINGITLPPANGFPFQLVAEDKWGYKWIRWLTEIELSNDPNYRGFWESRGYNNNGDVNGPKVGN
jgi:DMSO/TMAO reductase YedYZ molybdopterin-dependent catalytic subunit